MNAMQDPQGTHATLLNNATQILQDAAKQDALHAAILNDSAQQVQDALKNGANPNKEMEPPVKAGTKTDRSQQPSLSQSPLYLALIMKHQNAIQALLDGGAKPDEQSIQKALEESSFGNALLFLKKDPTISEQKIDYFMVLCMRNGFQPTDPTSPVVIKDPAVLEIIQQLINHGYNVNDIWFTQTGGGSSNLYWNDDALKLFLKNGANPNFIYIHGINSNTPLLQAIASTRNNRANLSGIKILLDAGANVNQKANPEESRAPREAKTPAAFASEKASHDSALRRFLQEKGGTFTGLPPIPPIINKKLPQSLKLAN